MVSDKSIYQCKFSKNNEISIQEIPKMLADGLGWPTFQEVEKPNIALYYALDSMLYGIVSNRGRMEILNGQCQKMLITVPFDF